MANYFGYSDMLNSPDLIIGKLENDLRSIDSELSDYIGFSSKVQIDNLIDFIRESNDKIHNYENIYPFIKEICTNQQINPVWYNKIEKVLEWALKKGRGKRANLSQEIKDAWLTYIIVLSCSMIDKEAELHPALRRFKSNSPLINLTEMN